MSAAARFTGDLAAALTRMLHFWEHIVGSGQAALALCEDWRAQLRPKHADVGMRSVRLHGLMSDDMGAVIRQTDRLLYFFFNAGQISDLLLSIGMRPFMELSFIPSARGSGGQAAFHCGANVASRRSYAKRAVLVRKFQYLNNIGEQDHRAIKGRCRPMLGFRSYRTAAVTLAGIEFAHRIGKRQFKFGPGRWSCWSLRKQWDRALA
jgi:hypothetical protein